jgi:GR25 family glycosyltransferase involved in LPS biosynthesis/tetratricopeptide (TPR) repeat protein
MFKNEEEILNRCLDSVKDLVDGFLLVDTGSTDNSIEIAKTYSPYVYQIEFEDFVITKNKVLEIAKDLPFDYILWMDADEYLNPTESDLFKETFHRLHSLNLSELITNIQNNHNDILSIVYQRPRIWKNDYPNIKFHGPGIHEFVQYMPDNIFEGDIKILHKHKTTNKDYQGNNTFYIDTLNKYYDKDNNDIRAIFYLARTYFDSGLLDLAIEFYQKYRETAKRINYIYNEEYWYTFYEEAQCYRRKKEFDTAVQTLKDAISFLPERKETYNLLGNIYHYDLNDSKSSIDILTKVDLNWGIENFRLFNEINLNEQILDLLSLSYYSQKEYHKSLDTLTKIKEINPSYAKDRINYNYNYIKEQMIPNIPKLKNKNIEEVFDNIFCINLERRTDRWKVISKKFEHFGLSVERFKGYDGRLLKPFINPDISVLRTGGYLGCLLSHLEVYRTALDRGYERILILEDDVVFHKHFHSEFKKIFNDIERDSSDWDLLYLGGANFTNNYTIGEPINQSTIKNYRIENGRSFDKVTNTWSCLAYAVNRKTMEKILDYYETNGYHYEIDLVIASIIQRDENFKCIKTMPQLIMHHSEDSDNDPTGRSFDYMERFLNEEYSKREDYI